MIFSLFRNGKETLNPEFFRIDAKEEHFAIIEAVIWARFIQRHLAMGGIIHHKTNFIIEAQEMGFHVRPVDA